MMTALHLPLAVLNSLSAHGEEAYPHECCGALLGHPTSDGWRIESAVRAANASGESPQNHFEIAPEELVKIVREARSRGFEIAGFYHSHPDHPAAWSASDLAGAHWVGCCYVITQVAGGRAVSTSSFLLDGGREEDKRFEPQTIVIDDLPRCRRST